MSCEPLIAQFVAVRLFVAGDYICPETGSASDYPAIDGAELGYAGEGHPRGDRSDRSRRRVRGRAISLLGVIPRSRHPPWRRSDRRRDLGGSLSTSGLPVQRLRVRRVGNLEPAGKKVETKGLLVQEGTEGAQQLKAEASTPIPDALRREFEALGLSPYETAVLLALLRLGSGTSLQLARLSEVPRTSTYQVLEELTAKRLAVRVPGPGAAVWASPGRDEVLARLDASEMEKLRLHRERAARVRDMLAATLPEAPTAALPYVHVIQSPSQTREIYDSMLADARSEFLVFNRPPYSAEANPIRLRPREIAARDEINPVVLGALSRGVAIRALYQRAQWDDPAAEPFREAMEAYHRSGVKGRLVDDLPIKLAVADRKIALITMTHPTLPEIGFPTTLLIEHPGAASVQADAFDRRWATARPCPRPGQPKPGAPTGSN